MPFFRSHVRRACAVRCALNLGPPSRLQLVESLGHSGKHYWWKSRGGAGAVRYPTFHDHVFGCVASVVRSNVQMVAGSTGLRGGDSRLHCTVLPVVPLAGGRGSGYVARPPRKRAKTRQKPRTAPRCSVVSPCTGRNRASLRRSSEPLQASQARATLRRPAAPEDQSRRPRRTRLLPQERPRAEEAEVDVKMTPLSAETVRGS